MSLIYSIEFHYFHIEIQFNSFENRSNNLNEIFR